MEEIAPPTEAPKGGFLRRLARDRAGNTLALMAAGVIPLIAMVGGAVDMSRAYLASARLQQACDAGVLAARKYLGSSVVVDNKVPAEVATIGNRFFNVNYRDGEYSTTDRSFNMFLEDDYAVAGEAAVKVPAIVMQMFGAGDIDVDVTCRAELSVPSVDIMMALDVTGSMRTINPGDTLSRMDSLKATIRNFYDKIEGGKNNETITRYGFVPYNANVNVGNLLKDDWVVDEWTYQSRENADEDLTVTYVTYWDNWVNTSGSVSDWTTESTYAATESTSTTTTGGGTGDTGTPETTTTSTSYSCTSATPSGTYSLTDTDINTTTEAVTDPDGTRTVVEGERVENGIQYRTVRSGTTCEVQSRAFTNYVNTFEKITEPRYAATSKFNYLPIKTDVTNWRAESDMCIEERGTYKISDYDDVDLTVALDLDIDTVPTPGLPDSQWRPRYPDLIWGRAMFSNGSGSWSTDNVLDTSDVYVKAGTLWNSDCPPAAQKLQEMTSDELDNYLATLDSYGSTYHDIGMIWAGRLLSPTGLFASENADTETIVRSRHLIWMTDGQTEPYDTTYGAYGLEPLDRRRWDPDTSTLTLTEIIEKRFAVACTNVKNLNITVWVIAFGTTTTPIMEDCAGEGRYFQASNADELNDAFTKIADSLGDLRITE